MLGSGQEPEEIHPTCGQLPMLPCTYESVTLLGESCQQMIGILCLVNAKFALAIPIFQDSCLFLFKICGKVDNDKSGYATQIQGSVQGKELQCAG